MIHENDGVGCGPRKTHFVGDDDHRHTVGAEVGDELQNSLDHFGIQRRGRLVEQHHLRGHRQCAGDRDPLLLATGQRAGTGIGLVLQANSVQLIQRQVPGRVRGQPPQLARSQRNVVQDAAVREEIELLEHHPHALTEFVGIVAQHRPAVEQDVAAIGLMQPVQRAQQRRLTRPDGPTTDTVLPAGASISTPRSTTVPPTSGECRWPPTIPMGAPRRRPSRHLLAEPRRQHVGSASGSTAARPRRSRLSM